MSDKFYLKLVGSIGIALYIVSPSWAEIRTIEATGEYRMGDNDTRADAKRLALLDAKRLALEQAGTYLESITEVKNLGIARDELSAYTAGIVEVTELGTKDVLDGATHVIRAQVTAKIDTDVVARQIDALRKNETVRNELVRVHAERNQLRLKVTTLTRELATIQSKAETEEARQPLRQTLAKLEAHELRARALRELVKQNTTAARRLADQALALEPSSPDVRSLMGVILMTEHHYEAAVHEFRAALRLWPENAEGHLNIAADYYMLGNALAKTGDKVGALAAFRTSHRLREPGDEVIHDSQAHVSLGAALAETGDQAGAIEAFHVALRLWPDNAAAHLNIAYVHSNSGDWAGAVEAYRAALRLRPNDAIIRYSMGTALRLKGDVEGAILEYRAALRLKPDDSGAHFGLGLALDDNGNLDGAIAEYRTALRLKWHDDGVHFFLGKALQRTGRAKEATKEFREFLRLASNEPRYRNLIDKAHTALRELER